jgi:hypothetical protein
VQQVAGRRIATDRHEQERRRRIGHAHPLRRSGVRTWLGDREIRHVPGMSGGLPSSTSYRA